MSERAKSVDTAEAAADAIKAYVRLNRKRLAGDGELLALLVPERVDLGDARDFQRFVIDRLTAENIALKAERDGLKASQHASARLGEGVRRFVLDLLDARSFAEGVVGCHCVIWFRVLGRWLQQTEIETWRRKGYKW